MAKRHIHSAIILILLSSCSVVTPFTTRNRIEESAKGSGEKIQPQILERGLASFYGIKFNGRKTASGELYTPNLYTAAHRTLPFGTTLRVTHETSGRSVVVRVNDRGPFKPGRVVDLSLSAARDLGIVSAGIAPVSVVVVDKESQTIRM